MKTEETTRDQLRAVFVNCSLKAEPADSHTRLLLERVGSVMEREGVDVDHIHARSHDIAFGMVKDATRPGETDAWPQIHDRIVSADIFVLGSPIWLGAISSVAALVIERMYAYSADVNDVGQYLYYGKTAGAVVTGNEDGVKACSRQILYALQHMGYAIPPQADCGWIGEIGPGSSYGDLSDDQLRPVGYDNDFTNRNATFLAWNLMHMATMLRAQGGIPAVGNTASAWRDSSNALDVEPTPIRT